MRGPESPGLENVLRSAVGFRDVEIMARKTGGEADQNLM
jgi:hypothetical protein